MEISESTKQRRLSELDEALNQTALEQADIRVELEKFRALETRLRNQFSSLFWERQFLMEGNTLCLNQAKSAWGFLEALTYRARNAISKVYAFLWK
jgi:hypothetical protein